MRLLRGKGQRDDRILHLVAGRVLEYPNPELLQSVPQLRSALGEQPSGPTEPLLGVLDYLAGGDLEVLRQTYVDTFDLSRKHALYLSYWTDGDTRRRGEVLGQFKKVYRESGFLVDTHGELPDYLPMVLEFAAIADPVTGRELLSTYRASLELLRIALVEHHSPYADAVVAVCATLPGRSPQTRAEVMAMAGLDGPPGVESVGLAPYGRTELPLTAVSGGSR
ncbi:respiratory nitrate reductase chaperone NarJ [Branchiibius hedensis]|uniref:Respiratory nitrate reductase chaperone NarJ n=1 Tax=Branchiibius hedensis TaxID=672460 RepID=A0A2Y8ZP09_9MICO|nr:nitrate reductase molybdenum cofactor assembly chaperone [Branchiibius hedensis]PWJ24849.1 respiratory nitrate reductase chaperone NarJ [Branchiibius hedensis]SSA33665.1 respiratory nitrate reductase chaperone NarJ [Branchiibius hedensis]